MNYLVMECHPGYAVVLSEDGRFLKVANLRYEVGQSLSEITELRLPRTEPEKASVRRRLSGFVAVAACLAVTVTGLLMNSLPYASVYMTINPEVRIDVNRSDRVVGVEGMNEDGAQLLEQYDPGRKDLDTVMDELVDRAIDMGYLHEGGRIVLNLDGQEDWVDNHKEHLNDHLTEYLVETITVTIDVHPAPPEAHAPAAPAGPIVIPVVPDTYGDSDYGTDADSDYGAEDSDYGTDGDSGYAAAGPQTEGSSDYEADSDYSSPGSGGSSFADGQTDYGEAVYESPVPAPAESDYNDSGYEEAESDYADGGDSAYDLSDYDD